MRSAAREAIPAKVQKSPPPPDHHVIARLLADARKACRKIFWAFISNSASGSLPKPAEPCVSEGAALMTIHYVLTYSLSVLLHAPRTTLSPSTSCSVSRGSTSSPSPPSMETELQTTARFTAARASSYDRFSPPLIRRSRSRRVERTMSLSSA